MLKYSTAATGSFASSFFLSREFKFSASSCEIPFSKATIGSFMFAEVRVNQMKGIRFAVITFLRWFLENNLLPRDPGCEKIQFSNH